MFGALGFTDLTFILNFYHQTVCSSASKVDNVSKFERVVGKQKLQTGIYSISFFLNFYSTLSLLLRMSIEGKI